MKQFDHLKESKCLSNNQNLKIKVAFLSLSENKISAEQANYSGKLPLTKALTTDTKQSSSTCRRLRLLTFLVTSGTRHALTAHFLRAALTTGRRR